MIKRTYVAHKRRSASLIRNQSLNFNKSNKPSIIERDGARRDISVIDYRLAPVKARAIA